MASLTHSPVITANESFPTGSAWTVPSSDCLFAADGNSATTSISAAGTSTTLRTAFHSFGSSPALPSGAVINGIEISLTGFASGTNTFDSVIQLHKSNTPSAADRVGSNYALTGSGWPTSSTTRTYGGPTDLWGTTWTAAEILATTFGVDIVINHTGTGTRTMTLDQMVVTVYYTDQITGIASATLSALTPAATGKLPVAGTVSRTLGALTSSGNAALGLPGTANGSLAALTGVSTGSLAIAGTGDITLGALTLFAIDEPISYGESSATFAPLTASATGTLVNIGSANASLAALGGASSGLLTVRGAGSPTLGAASLTATATVASLGTLNVTLAPAAVVAAGYQVLHTGSLTATLGAATLSSTVAQTFDDFQWQMAPFRPNWRDSYFVRYEFKTSIITSRSGKEQRSALRTYPRKQMRYTVTVHKDDMLSTTRLMEKYQGQSYTLPDWSRQATSAAPLTIGSNALLLSDDAPFWIEVTRAIVLVDAASGRQSRRVVQDVDGPLVSLEHGSVDYWPQGITILPAETGRFDTSIGSKQHTDLVAEVDVTFNVEPGYGPFDYAPRAVENFGGREIFPFSPNRASPIDGSFQHALDQVDFGQGRVTTYLPIAFGNRIRQVQVILPTLVDRMEMIAFFYRMKGQRGEFYMPTFDSDLTVAQPATAGDLTLRVAGSQVAELMDDTSTHRVIRLQWVGGFTFYRRIVDMVADGDETILTTDAGWPFDVSQQTLAAPLCWMTAARFASDTLEVECITTEVGRSTLPTMTLEDLPVSQIDNAWGLTDEEQAGVDLYGYSFTSPEMADPFDQFVNILYPDAVGG